MTEQEFQAEIKLGKSRSACAAEHIDGLIEIVKSIKDVPGYIVEVGSYRGGATIALAAASAYYCNPVKSVLGLDTFTGFPQPSQFDAHKFGEFGNANFQEVKEATSHLPNIQLIQGMHEETIPKLDHRPISLLFLDSDLYQSHLISLQHFWPNISKGGFVVFHDITTADCMGVAQAVNDFFGPPYPMKYQDGVFYCRADRFKNFYGLWTIQKV